MINNKAPWAIAEITASITNFSEKHEIPNEKAGLIDARAPKKRIEGKRRENKRASYDIRGDIARAKSEIEFSLRVRRKSKPGEFSLAMVGIVFEPPSSMFNLPFLPSSPLPLHPLTFIPYFALYNVFRFIR